jgi:hypothetical protein
MFKKININIYINYKKDMESSFLTNIQKSPFLFLADHPWDYYNSVSKVLNESKNGNVCDDQTFYRTFMSEINIQYINNMIKKTVYNNSCDKYIVRDQKREHLEQIMKGLYNDHAQHLQFNQKEQFAVLNKIIIDYCVGTILNELESRFKYIRDKFSPLELLPSPINSTSTGSKSFLPYLSTSYNFNVGPNDMNTDSADVFDDKIIDTDTGSLPIQPQINYQPYYFTDDKTNMFAIEKSLTTDKIPVIPQNIPSNQDNSYLNNNFSQYTSSATPVKNYYVPKTDNTRSRPY